MISPAEAQRRGELAAVKLPEPLNAAPGSVPGVRGAPEHWRLLHASLKEPNMNNAIRQHSKMLIL